MAPFFGKQIDRSACQMKCIVGFRGTTRILVRLNERKVALDKAESGGLWFGG